MFDRFKTRIRTTTTFRQTATRFSLSFSYEEDEEGGYQLLTNTTTLKRVPTTTLVESTTTLLFSGYGNREGAIKRDQLRNSNIEEEEKRSIYFQLFQFQLERVWMCVVSRGRGFRTKIFKMNYISVMRCSLVT